MHLPLAKAARVSVWPAEGALFFLKVATSPLHDISCTGTHEPPASVRGY